MEECRKEWLTVRTPVSIGSWGRGNPRERGHDGNGCSIAAQAGLPPLASLCREKEPRDRESRRP